MTAALQPSRLLSAAFLLISASIVAAAALPLLETAARIVA